MMAIMIIVPTMPAEIMVYVTGKVALLWLFGFFFYVESVITNKKYENSMF